MNQCQSELERRWLRILEENGLHLPSKAQTFIEACNTRPDFHYKHLQTVVYVDGPPHESPERQDRDKDQTECMENAGYTVIRFKHHDNWKDIIAKHPTIFGKIS
jgi:very-short-patch-repair endonuclease